MQPWFDGLSIWTTLLGSFIVLLAAAELGLRAGIWHRRRGAGPDDMIGSLHGATLGLLALMIGFTFSIALGRFDARREAVLQEANAIGTAALRARMLPELQVNASLALLRDYAQGRIIDDGTRIGTLEASDFTQRATALQNRLWREAEAASAADARSVPIGLYVQALNDVIDMHEKRITGLRSRVPAIVFAMLHGIAALALGFTGYNAGLGERGHRVAVMLMAAMLASVMMLVADLDAPQRGMVMVSQQPLQDLLAGFPQPPR